MSYGVALVWLGAGASLAAHQASLQGWARAHMVAITRPAPDAPPALGYDATLAQRVEDQLDAATIALGALDDAGALARLGDARQLLDSHPELPQAAFLLAEWLHDAAAVAERRGDAARARDLVQQAQAIEGVRAPTYAPGSDGAAPAPAPASTPTTRVHMEGLTPGDTLYWDGAVVGERVAVAAGRHHARVIRRGRAVWASWIGVANGATRVHLAVPAPTACSLDDIGGARVVHGAAVAPAGARCPRWAVARTAGDGAIELASCHEASCGPLLTWHADDGAFYTGPPQPRERATWPSWATYLLAGIGVTAATSFVMWQGGVFDHPAAPRTGFRYYGP